MRPCDIDRSGDVWVYRPRTHKTQHHGHHRTVLLGPKAQAILRPYLLRAAHSHCFSPADAMQEMRDRRAAARKTPLNEGNRRGTNRVENPKRQAGEAYTVNSYRRAIGRACDLAFLLPDDLPEGDLPAWQKAHRWSPHQLRHSAATEIRKHHGLEAAQILLGHSAADVTQVYAERDMAKGIHVARLIG